MRRASTALVPRLHVLSRPETPHAVIIRRGPTRTSATIAWNLDTDEMAVGQMMAARMFPFHSDISADGASMYYMAYNGKPDDPDTLGSYGVLSRAPYLKAVKLWPARRQWGGARLFHAGGQLRIGTYHQRLERDGWHTVPSPLDEPGVTVVRKAITRWCTLEKSLHGPGTRHGRPMFHDTHRILDRAGHAHDKDGWDWAEVRDGRLLWTCRGVLHASRVIDDDGRIRAPRVLRDFTEMPFERLRAPY